VCDAVERGDELSTPPMLRSACECASVTKGVHRFTAGFCSQNPFRHPGFAPIFEKFGRATRAPADPPFATRLPYPASPEACSFSLPPPPAEELLAGVA
jgi:hypothetical protein